MQSPILGAAPAPGVDPDAEHHLDLVRSAIALLATGGARRVTLVNLVLDDDTLRTARAVARESGMLVRLAPNGAGAEIAVEASG